LALYLYQQNKQNMKKITSVFIIAFIAFGLQTNAQTFTVTANRKSIGAGDVTKGKIAKLPSLKMLTASAVILDFKAVKEASNVSIIAMDNNRQELGDRVTVENFKGGKITMPISTAIRSSKAGVSLYIIKLSTDPNVAAAARVAPILIATFK
jgi:hypothetical protein